MFGFFASLRQQPKMSDIKLVAGLGNPGKEYEQTRHNVGFRVVDLLSEKLGIAVTKKKFGGLVGEGFFESKKLILLKPQQYMNLSGQVLATAAGFYKLGLDDILVVSDDMALDVGRIRVRGKGSSGGQKGLGDIIAKLGSDEFARLRIGIGDSGRIPAVDYVLGRFNGEQQPEVDKAILTAYEAVVCWLCSGTEAAMNKFNAAE